MTFSAKIIYRLTRFFEPWADWGLIYGLSGLEIICCVGPAVGALVPDLGPARVCACGWGRAENTPRHFPEFSSSRILIAWPHPACPRDQGPPAGGSRSWPCASAMRRISTPCAPSSAVTRLGLQPDLSTACLIAAPLFLSCAYQTRARVL